MRLHFHRKKGLRQSIIPSTSFGKEQKTFKVDKNSLISTINVFLSKRKKTSEQTSAIKRALVIVPGYSVSNPPQIGDHRFYIQKLQFHPNLNPQGYKKIFLFDLYSKESGRCNFHLDIPALAEELYSSLTNFRSPWNIQNNETVDFIGASMGGLIVRALIHRHLREPNLIGEHPKKNIKVGTVVLIGTPNRGCKIVDYLQAPIIQKLLAICYGKNHFAISKQFKQIAKGGVSIIRPLTKFSRKKTPKNVFLESLNVMKQTPGTIRWITIRGTKRTWYGTFLYGKELNDGVVSARSVPLTGAENIVDYALPFNLSWSHRDLYQNDNFCSLLYGLLVLNLKLTDYQLFREQEEAMPEITATTLKRDLLRHRTSKNERKSLPT